MKWFKKNKIKTIIATAGAVALAVVSFIDELINIF